jgi:hypothetical protein
MKYFALVRPELEYAFVAWNYLQILIPIQRIFAALYHNRLCQDVERHYDNSLEKLSLLTLHSRRHHFDALS